MAADREPFGHLSGVLADTHQLGRKIQTVDQDAHWVTAAAEPGLEESRLSNRKQKSA